MNGIYELAAILQILIPLSAVPRIIYCLLYIAMDNEQASTYKRRIRNLLIFVALAEGIAGLIVAIKSYF